MWTAEASNGSAAAGAIRGDDGSNRGLFRPGGLPLALAAGPDPSSLGDELVVFGRIDGGVTVSRYSQFLARQGETEWAVPGAFGWPRVAVGVQFSPDGGEAVASLWGGVNSFVEARASPTSTSPMTSTWPCPGVAFFDGLALGHRGSDGVLLTFSTPPGCQVPGVDAGLILQRVNAQGVRSSFPMTGPRAMLGSTVNSAWVLGLVAQSLEVRTIVLLSDGGMSLSGFTRWIDVTNDPELGDLVENPGSDEVFVTGLGSTGANTGTASISLPFQPRTAFIGRLTPNPAWLTALGPARIGSPVPAALTRDGADAGVLLVMWELPDAGLAYARLRPGDGGLLP